MFGDLLKKIDTGNADFTNAWKELQAHVDSAEIMDFMDILGQIGTIPENIDHDSTAEKLFSKASDAILSRAFREIGMKSTVLRERGDSADVLAESCYHDYTLVADAKAFRMSRTAKNQKDFKVGALSGWRKEHDYAVLCSPYFQYPTANSQIYAQAVDYNVGLLSWEHFLFLIENKVKETPGFKLSSLWNYSRVHASSCPCSEKKQNFIQKINVEVANLSGCEPQTLSAFLQNQAKRLIVRGNVEKAFWNREMERIQRYSREQAIKELIETKRIKEKILQINSYLRGLGA